MYTKEITVKNPTGLHARPASEFVDCAAGFSSKIQIARGDEPDDPVNAKSMVLLLTLGLAQDDVAVISAEGEEEVQAVDTLVALIESGFGE